MLARSAIALAALVALATCNRINPYFDSRDAGTSEGSGQTGTSSGSASASDASGDDGGSGGTGGGTFTDDQSDSSGGVGSGTTATGSSSTTTQGVEMDLLPQRDAYIRQLFPTQNHGNDDNLRAGSGSTSNRANRLLIRFDTTLLEPGCNFSQALLRLFYFEDGSGSWDNVDPVLGAYRVTKSWNEGRVTWNSPDGNSPWNTPGGDFDPAVIDEVTVTGGQYGWVSFDVTATVMGWCHNTLPNDGLIVLESPDSSGDQGRKLFYSSEHATDPDLRPMLRVQ